MTKNIPSWEKRFLDKFYWGKKVKDSTNKFSGEECELLATFISQLLKEQREEVVRKLEGERIINFTTNGQRGKMEDEIMYQINETINRILSRLKETKEGEE